VLNTQALSSSRVTVSPSVLLSGLGCIIAAWVGVRHLASATAAGPGEVARSPLLAGFGAAVDEVMPAVG
jgi:hypothetical protein